MSRSWLALGLAMGVLLATGIAYAQAEPDVGLRAEIPVVLEGEPLQENPVSAHQVAEFEAAAQARLVEFEGGQLRGNFGIEGPGNLNGILNRASTSALGPVYDGDGLLVAFDFQVDLKRVQSFVLVRPSPYIEALQEAHPALAQPQRVRVHNAGALRLRVDSVGEVLELDFMPQGEPRTEVELMQGQASLEPILDTDGSHIVNNLGLHGFIVNGDEIWVQLPEGDNHGH